MSSLTGSRFDRSTHDAIRSTPTVTLVVPTRNEAANIGALYDRIAAALPGGAWQLLFVDDSDDDTRNVIRALADGDDRVRLLHRSGDDRDGGLGGAVRDGLANATSSWAIVMDADLQHPPEVLPDMVAAMTPDTDVVVATRYAGDGSADGLASGIRRSGSIAAATLARALFPIALAGVSDPMSGFFAVRLSAVDIDRLKPRGFKILLEILGRHSGLRVAEVPFSFATRIFGESKASPREALRYLRQLVPLRFAPHAGVGRLPLPPTDHERDSYLGTRQHRWIFVAQAFAFGCVLVSLFGVITRSDWMFGLFTIPAILLVGEQVLALRTSTHKRRVDLAQHRSLVRTWHQNTQVFPTVDIFVPVCGEDPEIIENTLAHASRIEWPGTVSVNLLDDGRDPRLRDIAECYGATYFARRSSAHKKAGNLQYGMERTKGEFIVILDADFVARSDFLHELMPYTQDDSVGIVQSPQYFDTGKGMGWIQRSAGATQEMFFRFIQPSRDACDGAICVGTSAIYRRAALNAIGGFPLIGHSEDVYTGVAMAEAKYVTRYIPVVVSRGTCPTDLSSFARQQYRWCEGSVSLMSSRRFHDNDGLSRGARLGFWSGFLYYVITAMMALLAPLPLLLMAALYPASVSPRDMVALIPALLFWVVLYPMVATTRWRYSVLRVQLVYSFAHLVCIFDQLRGRSAGWVATGRADAGLGVSGRISALLCSYVATTQIATAVLLAVDTARYGIGRYWASLALFALSAYVFCPPAVVFASELAAAWRARPKLNRDPQPTVARRHHSADIAAARSVEAPAELETA
jgi:cellulose synthase (UDP-forming)